MRDVLCELDAVIAARRQTGDAESSYVARLCRNGLDHVLKKVAEECGETLVAAKNAAHGGDREALVREVADLWFHSMVMLALLDRSSQDVIGVLQERFGLSGLEEQAARSAASQGPGALAAGTD
jgi:phosphoribosyl-ATP pyrophosphohydrolase